MSATPRGWIRLTDSNQKNARLNARAIAFYCMFGDGPYTSVAMIGEELEEFWFRVVETPEEIDKLIAESQGE